MAAFSTLLRAITAIRVLTFTAISFTILTVICFVYAAVREQRYTLPALVLFGAVLFIASVILLHYSPRPLLMTFDLGSKLILITGMLLALQLVLRIMADADYGGSWSDFDFGCKVDADDEFECFWKHYNGSCAALQAANIPANKRCPGFPDGTLQDFANKAFVFEYQSLGHMIYGVSACLFFPCWEYMLRNWPRLLIAIQLVQPPVFLFYPLYNIIKRSMHGPSYFARTSFCNNGAEWSVGFVIGGALGFMLCALCGIIDREAGVHPYLIQWCNWKLRIRLVVSALLTCTWLVAAALYCASWNLSREKQSQPDGDLAALLLVPIVLTAPVAFLALHPGAQRGQDNSIDDQSDAEMSTVRRKSSDKQDGTAPLILSSVFSQSDAITPQNSAQNSA